MPEAIRNDYEISSEGAVRHWKVPYARMEDATPTETQPALLLGRVAGKQVGGTVLTIDAVNSIAIVDFTSSMVYKHSVRDVLTYNAAVEATWGAINIGDPIYYDNSATMPAGTKLSTSPLDNTGAANSLWGYAAYSDRITYPLGSAAAATVLAAVMQTGAGGGA